VTTIDTPLLNIRQAANRLGISVETAYRLARHRELPTLKIGGSLRVDPRELETWLDERRTDRRGGD